jgi:predicted unusual protein kinase regulating ubiquinone biosynthesis (AarF/ABC1/UbiB family)
MLVGTTAARVGAKAVRHKLSASPSKEAKDQHEAEVGKLIFAAVTQLRGTALKAAQMLSMDASVLPEGIRAQLARASHQALPLNRALVSRAFRQAFGREPQSLYAHFDTEAFAAASLGQVHRARLDDGTEVAVKVQYPGIAETIDSDLRLLRSMLRTVGGKRIGLPPDELIDQMLAEVRNQLAEEVDYLHEAGQQAWFIEHARHADIVMPQVVSALTCKTVLTQQSLRGLHLDASLQQGPSQVTRDRQAQAIFDWFVDCAFERRHIHADMHLGNLLFLEDERVGVLDFGCTRKLSMPFVRGLARSWLTWLRQGADGSSALLDNYRELGVAGLDLGLKEFEQRILPKIAPVLGWATQPFVQERFEFSSKTPFPMPDFDGRSQHPASFIARLPPELLSFDRAWFGLMHLLTRLQGRVDTRAALGKLEAAAG